MKKAFDIPAMLMRVEEAVKPYPKAAMFALFERGHTSLFEQLISCIISIRTLDETTIPLSEALFAQARTPEQLLKLKKETIADLLYGSQFPGQKADTLLGIAKAAIENYGGHLPADYQKLTALKGVGPKCAKLALGVASRLAGISVDVHVHRVVNRWGLTQTTSPELTMVKLEELVPRKSWIDVNRLLMPFGKNICTGRMPKCSTCPVADYCQQRGVEKHR